LFDCERHAETALLRRQEAALARSNALAGPLRQPSAMGSDMGSGRSPRRRSLRHRRSPGRPTRRRLRDVEVSGHVGVNGTGQDGVNVDAVPSQQCALRLCEGERGCLRDRVCRHNGNGANAASDNTLTIARERVSCGRNAWVTACAPKRFTSRCCSSTARSLKSSKTARPRC
jgi:hypothetical protein